LALLVAACGLLACVASRLANADPFCSRPTFVAEGVLGSKNVVQFAAIVAEAPPPVDAGAEVAAGAEVVAAAAEVAAGGVELEDEEELGVEPPPHAAVPRPTVAASRIHEASLR
jgi:hypothetical protein